MRPSLLLPALLIGAFLSAGHAADPGQTEIAIGRDTTIGEDDVYCLLTSPIVQYEVGDTPDLLVTVFNGSEQTVYLVGSLDGSERQSRYPHAYYTISGPPNGVKTEPLVYCGNLNGLRREDFIHLHPGESFDPYMNIDSGGFFAAAKLRASKLTEPGEYRFTFHYSTASPTIDDWKGTVEHVSIDALELLKRVPRVEIRCSVDVRVVE
jgi:hypothetical protein